MIQMTEEQIKELVDKKIKMINNASISLAFLERDIEDLKEIGMEADNEEMKRLEMKLAELKRKILTI